MGSVRCHSGQTQPISEGLQANALTLQAKAQTHPQAVSPTVPSPGYQKWRNESFKVYECWSLRVVWPAYKNHLRLRTTTSFQKEVNHKIYYLYFSLLFFHHGHFLSHSFLMLPLASSTHPQLLPFRHLHIPPFSMQGTFCRRGRYLPNHLIFGSTLATVPEATVDWYCRGLTTLPRLFLNWGN